MVSREKSRFEQFNKQQVPRTQNEKVDKLARLTSSIAENLDPRILMENLTKPSIETEEGKEVNMASPEPKWASKIIKYLKDEGLPENRDEVRKVKVRASRYLPLNDTLYQRSFTLPLLRCLSSQEVDYVLRKIHEGVCGNHSRDKTLASKVIRAEGIIGSRCKKMQPRLSKSMINAKGSPISQESLLKS